MTILCHRCRMYGRSEPLLVGHRCIGEVVCDYCDCPREVQVVQLDARGALSVVLPCACRKRAGAGS